jgi:hypothetical protein
MVKGKITDQQTKYTSETSAVSISINGSLTATGDKAIPEINLNTDSRRTDLINDNLEPSFL